MSHTRLKELKEHAKVLARELETLGYPSIAHTHLLQALSKSVGFKSWSALRAAATAETIPAASASNIKAYPRHYCSATYKTTGFTVDVVRWDDQEVGLGYGYYCYDAYSGLCLTPIRELLFTEDEVPSYEQVSDLVVALEDYSICESCENVARDEGIRERSGVCTIAGCRGIRLPFLDNV